MSEDIREAWERRIHNSTAREGSKPIIDRLMRSMTDDQIREVIQQTSPEPTSEEQLRDTLEKLSRAVWKANRQNNQTNWDSVWIEVNIAERLLGKYLRGPG